jgi:hypothetical protein
LKIPYSIPDKRKRKKKKEKRKEKNCTKKKESRPFASDGRLWNYSGVGGGTATRGMLLFHADCFATTCYIRQTAVGGRPAHVDGSR